MIDVLGLLEEKKASVQAWQEEIQSLLSCIEQAQVEIGSLEHVQRIHESCRPTDDDALRTDTTPSLIEQVQAQPNQKEAMLVIARQNNGLVKVKEAAPLMVKAGQVTGNPKHAYGHMYELVDEDERYEKVGPAKYQLKAEFV